MSEIILFIIGVMGVLFPILVLRSFYRLQKETDAMHDTQRMIVLHQKRTNELLERLGAIQQPVDSP